MTDVLLEAGLPDGLHVVEVHGGRMLQAVIGSDDDFARSAVNR